MSFMPLSVGEACFNVVRRPCSDSCRVMTPYNQIKSNWLFYSAPKSWPESWPT